MSWLDPARLDEPAEDRALREELRGLLGGPAPLLQAEVTPEMVALADELRREALRRRHVASPRRSGWLLAAAALPFLLGVAGMGAWGFHQKQRADDLTQAMARQEDQHQQQLVAVGNQLKSERETKEELVRVIQKAAPVAARRLQGRELVIPVDRNPIPAITQTQQVKQR
ncbi:MAG: hypothetical protein LWX11_08380 [Firmicutes bacterium]|nr:hypothetical protein [Bacillota bacterium]